MRPSVACSSASEYTKYSSYSPAPRISNGTPTTTPGSPVSGIATNCQDCAAPLSTDARICALMTLTNSVEDTGVDNSTPDVFAGSRSSTNPRVLPPSVPRPSSRS
ncbi:hypothetical protein GCM10025873_28100 [Demequina sediminis]|uniref:hypothetical protein n=1 Tax=Demequina sediminis TaxID=1930058 RepID=UPI002572CB0C|nr:hypothetical protein [Demequina sediminis]BDZ60240.1 hypothetical protein GCM10025873_00310 [Demequina sediminis]BDZ63019.1 hypothetical protein GCM10025873_28100 [Demequina sediminis]